MMGRDLGDVTSAPARTSSPDPDDTDSDSDSVISSDHGYLNDYTPAWGPIQGNIDVQPNSSTSEGARGVPNSASQVDYTEELEYEAFAELVDYFDFIRPDPLSPGQLHNQGQLYEAAQSGLISQEKSMERPEVMTPSRKRGRADSATQFESCKRHNVSTDPTRPGQLHYQGQLYDPSWPEICDEFASDLPKELMDHRDRGRVDSATQIDYCLHHNVFEQFPDLELDSTKTPWHPFAGLETGYFDTLPITLTL